MIVGLCIPFEEASAEPIDFMRPRMTFALGIDAFDYFKGDFGDAASVGMSLFGEVSLEIGYVGGALRFGTARAFTEKDYLPYDEGFQYIYITAAPRFYYAPLRSYLYFFIQPEISMHILESNTLVLVTGNDAITGSAGGSLGVQYIMGILSVIGQVSCEYDWKLKSILVTGGISIGLSSTIE